MTSHTGEFSQAETRYTEVLRRQRDSATLRRIYRDAYGADYPEEIDPFGFVTRTDLRRIADLVGLRPGQRLADIGCGRGGPGLWVAGELDVSLVGVDVVAAAVAEAAERSAELGRARARFAVGSFTATGLPAASCDAVMSVDALWMVWDKPAAMTEVARVLTLGGRFVFTTWEPAYLDHRALLAEAGLDVLVREETPDWLSRQLAVYRGILAHRRQLAEEMGQTAAAVLIAEARETRPVLPSTPRLLIAARRRPAR
ncbi:class I SAM-dependent methyltransferase [Goodfellowiella coeruleoviolacea]|uniref:Methyltransferase domain-containing protein n=1 Tax=Goodfellowiella coeruleoviolacea TaxID=334858 RepID=A0AAE3G7P9_9PSEU|nr:methyltransferase domain-containing protein [Goodfellowiella coeruleoviolacea]MCP2163246.1 Methyltransferase domain-containing protein [Goodfellowiella coeruleoviolacea]